LEIVRREAALLADRAKRERSSVLAAVARASADAPPLPDQGFVLSQGVPAPLALPFAPGRVLDPTRSPLGADEAEDEQTSDEEEDATGDEPEDPTAELGEQLSPLPEAPSPVAPPNEILESVASALEVVSSGWRLRRPPSTFLVAPTSRTSTEGFFVISTGCMPWFGPQRRWRFRWWIERGRRPPRP
jgi:hypothetical protein